jgi:hypothetical protein
MESTKQKWQSEEMQQEANKRMRANMRASKKKFDELWLVKSCAAIGDSLHTD